MRRKRALAWVGAGLALATAVIALRETQPAVTPLPAAPNPPTAPNAVARFAVDGVLLPEPVAAPAPPPVVEATATGPERLRVAWGTALPGGSAPANAVGYEVRWRPGQPDGAGSDGVRLVATPEVELDGLAPGVDQHIEVRSIDAFGRRSAATPASVVVDGHLPDLRNYSGLAEPFDGPFSVDSSVVGGRWHVSGYRGCTSAAADRGVLVLELDCGGDLAVLRARSPMRLGPAGGRVLLVTDAAGPLSAVTVDLVPGPVERLGKPSSPGPSSPGPSSPGPSSPGPSSPGPSPGGNGAAALDPTLPDGTVRVVIGDGGAHVVTGPGVPRLPSTLQAPPPAATRGAGVLHVFEVAIDGIGLRVMQDGIPVAVAAVAPPWTQANLLVGVTSPPGRQSRVRLDAVGFTGPALPAPPSYVLPVVPATQRVLGPDEIAPGIGISRRPLVSAAAAKLVATIDAAPGVDLGQLVVQHGDVVLPARPVLAGGPDAAGAQVTVAAELPAGLLGPVGPAAISPLVLRAPGAQASIVPVVDSYLEIVPQPGTDAPAPARARVPRPPPPLALPRPSVRLLDSESNEVATAPHGARLILEVTVDGLGGQLDGASLAGVAGFQLWLDRRQVAGVPTAADGPGVAGSYRVALSTRSLVPGRHVVELRLVPVDPAVKPLSVLMSWRLLG